MTTTTATTTQVYRVYIKATPQAVWDAIVKPEWTERYGYTGLVDYDLRPGGTFKTYPSKGMREGAAANGYPMQDVIVDGEVIESDPPRRLVQTWRMLMDPSLEAEGFTRLTYDIQELPGGEVTSLTVTHELDGAPGLAAMVRGDHAAEGAGGGWSWVLSDLKTLLETGKGFSPSAA
jgi:uncharacterized protein YndB with AHSA1/START domain